MDGAREQKRRKLAPEARRQQLIEATIEVIATQGLARTTQAEVARTAGLSHGLVNFHFSSKDKLLGATLSYLAEEYRANWQQALVETGEDPAARLNALILADFRPDICASPRLSAWCAFWGEAQSRPMYQDNCGDFDEEYIAVQEGICRDLIEAGGYDLDPVRAARVLRVTTEGTWLDLLTMRTPYDRDEALRTVMTCAGVFFPRHFSEKGLS
ncbi:TetR/AcrR family transcriptional regulator [Pseudoroseicyclus tamaricis]|uniref:TetR/AcrR family transcriptional regulator n=1 Tax=Pseudoroseicyclus tamaricis TaxID=2705421 RepID=A0A6B2K1J0_9RHOB|nr:TetR/AcrR family transcriptional regulator [Pseudoroseicyclus tamaricis]NDV00226.1 TetR/AcrR family transcriptional regulator [Pseudoroseicyclus tamaricis]